MDGLNLPGAAAAAASFLPSPDFFGEGAWTRLSCLPMQASKQASQAGPPTFAAACPTTVPPAGMDGTGLLLLLLLDKSHRLTALWATLP